MKCNPWVGGSIGRRGFPMLGTGKRGLSTYVKELFANGEQGFFYDPNDLSTMYRDAAGTVPVTGVGQSVGLLLDKSKGLVLGSNQISYPNSEELPATVNMGDAVGTWGLNTNAPISGTQDSRLIITEPSSNAGRPVLTFLCSSPLVPDKLYKFSFRYKVNSGAPRIAAVHKGDFTSSVPLDKGILQGSGTFNIFIRWVDGSQTIPIVYFSNESVFDLQVAGISVREVKGNHAYQTTSASRPILRKNAVTGANYLEFDGSDDFLQTSNIDFTVTDKVSLFAGVAKLLDSGQIIAELSSSYAANAGSFYLFTGTDGGNGYTSAARGSNNPGILLSARNFTYPTPDVAVLSAKHDISGDLSSIRRNGIVGINGTGDKGAGNFGNYPLFIGRRGGTLYSFNGHIYSLIGVGRLTTESETAAIEEEIAKRIGVSLNV